MARGTTLANCLIMLKVEMGLNLTGNTGVDSELKQLLAQKQQWLWTEYQWPFLYTHEDVAVQPAVRFYNDLAVVSPDYETRAETKWGDIWYPVGYGISGDDYTVSDPDRQQTLDPIRKWQDKPNGTFEVWPVPSSAQTLRFWGTSVCSAFAADNDTCTLDDLLIVLFVAAEKLKAAKQPHWQDKRENAEKLFQRLKGANRPNTMFAMNGEEQPEERNRNRKAVTILTHS